MRAQLQLQYTQALPRQKHGSAPSLSCNVSCDPRPLLQSSHSSSSQLGPLTFVPDNKSSTNGLFYETRSAGRIEAPCPSPAL